MRSLFHAWLIGTALFATLVPSPAARAANLNMAMFWTAFEPVLSGETGNGNGLWSCAIVQGGLQCWGTNNSGQLGDGTTISRSTPAWVSGLGRGSGVIGFAIGSSSTYAVTSSGALYSWGDASSGRLGNASGSGNYLTPGLVSGLGSGVIAVASTNQSACAVKSDGTVWCWGGNSNHEHSDGTTNVTTTPVQALNSNTTGDFLTGVVQISGGPNHYCALTSGGGVRCWGSSCCGEMGNGATGSPLYNVTPTGLSSGVNMVLAVGDRSCVILSANGGMQCFGYGGSGQLGNQGGGSLVPVNVVDSSNTPVTGATKFAGGQDHTCAVINGAVYCWGYNNQGMLGTGDTTGYNYAHAVPMLTSGIHTLFGGNAHTCAAASRRLWCWGRNAEGQLGSSAGNTSCGGTTCATSPVGVSGF